MLKTNRLIKMALLVGLGLGCVLLLSGLSFSNETEGVVRDYDDSYGARHRTISDPHLDVKVWVDKGGGATYSPGEQIRVYFQASRDCYVVIYNIDTRGYTHLLYPCGGRADAYVEGGRVYRIPDKLDDYDLTVDGPNGVEYIQAVAGLDPVSVPNFPGEYASDEETYAYKLDGEDPFEFMADIDSEIAPDDYASDVCIFNVEYQHPEWYYWPQVVYVDRPVDLCWGEAYFDYPWGMEVWVDGVFYGITPLTIPALVVGRHYCSFWFDGCWIWRDWVHVRRDHCTRVWADCHDRYRYVEDRVVEKSYRVEKAKRRRGGDEMGGLVRPVRHADSGGRSGAEIARTEGDKELRRELPAKRRAVEDRVNTSRTAREIKSSRTDRDLGPGRIWRSLPSEKDRYVPERRMRAREIIRERETPRRMERIKGLRSRRDDQMLEREDRIREKTESEIETKRDNREPKWERPGSQRDSPVSFETPASRGVPRSEQSGTTRGGEARTDRPQGRRR
ncbi:MAG: DUF4384 domain-containing protein [Candidatus Zixiibacteriota bacterium]